MRRRIQKRVVPLLGFSWGFVIGEKGRIALRPVERIPASDWIDQLPYLRDRHPNWQFSEPTPGSAWPSGATGISTAF
jgi:hypothetical protein